jgi:Met-zincin/Domain of unknown function (DUF5117)
MKNHLAVVLRSLMVSLGLTLVGAAPAPPATAPVPIEDFTKTLVPANGLFTVWRKDGKVYIQIKKSQLDTDFIQTATPANGIGGYGVAAETPYVALARIMRFSRADNTIVISWPNTSFVADGEPSAQQAVSQSFAPSIVAVTPIVAEDAKTGDVIFDASPFLGDLIDMQNFLRFTLDTDKAPAAAYHLDPTRSYFGQSKAFPDNVILEADQTFESEAPQTETEVKIDNVPDPRSVQIRIRYNILQAPAEGSYMPRIADDRVGYFSNVLLNYGNDNVNERQLRYITRWNPARLPVVYYISNSVPPQYRDTIRAALLTWNQAFARIGIPNAVVVKDQPDDQNWDEDDVRYNVVHWLTQSNSGGYAEAEVVFDPRTGELLKSSIALDADLLQVGYLEGEDFAAPTRPEPHGFAAEEAAFAAGARATMNFGVWALGAMGQAPWGQAPPGYVQSFLYWVVLHESGHNWGLQHNFIGTSIYSAAELQNVAFTTRNGVASSVMGYLPVNLWPRGTRNGTYFQHVLGTYDYYAIHWGYAPVPNAQTPQQEVPTLRSWASHWSDPRYRFESDEDVDWADGHAIDPRVAQWSLSNDNLSWCGSQIQIGHAILDGLAQRYNVSGASHDAQRTGFEFAFSPFSACAHFASHYLGGEYLSRAHVGDPGASLPLEPVSRAESHRAFLMLDRELFAANAWQISPLLLRSMTYSEWSPWGGAPWQYDPSPRHDLAVAEIIKALQQSTLTYMFQPLLLERLDDMPMKYPAGSTMSLADLFQWTDEAVYGDLRNGAVGKAGAIHRSLQQWYARKLVSLAVAPAAGVPYDAQALARAELVRVQSDVAQSKKAKALDVITRAHLDLLAAIIHQALNANLTTTASSK